MTNGEKEEFSKKQQFKKLYHADDDHYWAFKFKLN